MIYYKFLVKNLFGFATEKLTILMVLMLTVSVAYSRNLSDSNDFLSKSIALSIIMGSTQENCITFNDWQKMTNLGKPIAKPAYTKAIQNINENLFKSTERDTLALAFPPPSINKSDCENQQDQYDLLMLFDYDISSVLGFLLSSVFASTLSKNDEIFIDGDISDWSLVKRMNVPNNFVPNFMTENILYCAYKDNRVFFDKNNGDFAIQIGYYKDAVTRITEIPMRSNLFSVTGGEDNMRFYLDEECNVRVELSSNYNTYLLNMNLVNIEIIDSQELLNILLRYGIHEVSIARQ